MAPGMQHRAGRVSQRAPIAARATPPGGPGTPFHEGERAVQRRAGVERMAAQVGRNILSFVPAEFGAFLGRQPFVVVASQDQDGRVWASLIAGGAGFARSLDDRRILLAGMPAPGDPLEGALERPQARIGVLAIEFGTRQRIRLNGTAQRTGEGILLTVAEAFGNCPKFIQRRLPAGQLTGSAAPAHRQSAALDARQAVLVRRADTFFIASAHPWRGADASHRGGRPGFVELADAGRQLTFPDYSGNRMFQTLGNLTVNPRTGLLLLDWETGDTLQLTGRAQVLWDGHALGSRPGAERLVEVSVDAVHEHERAMPARWSLIEPYRRNPPVNPLEEQHRTGMATRPAW
jgi:predicted pyridoxine 5'-phosphate oxidase superfamily flavin-nucleotide-binding protein